MCTQAKSAVHVFNEGGVYIVLILGLSPLSHTTVSMAGFLVGVDVGTNSARAGLFSSDGDLIRHCSREIRVWNEFGCLEQSSEDIWKAVCFCVKVRSSFINRHEEDGFVARGHTVTLLLLLLSTKKFECLAPPPPLSI